MGARRPVALSLTAQFIGIHAIFGAFLLGAVIPHDSEVARDFRIKLEDIVKILLLPAFFAYTGMRTQIGLVSGLAEWADRGLDYRWSPRWASLAAPCRGPLDRPQ